MLSREIRVALENHALGAVGISPDGVGDLRAVGDVDDEGANRVRAVIQSDGVASAHVQDFLAGVK